MVNQEKDEFLLGDQETEYKSYELPRNYSQLPLNSGQNATKQNLGDKIVSGDNSRKNNT